jgi:hypothetical protein
MEFISRQSTALFTGQLTSGLKSADWSKSTIIDVILRPTGSSVEVTEELVTSSKTQRDRGRL